jgi:hypothetical protein
MKRFRLSLLILLAPALSLAVALVGCSGDTKKETSTDGDKDSGTSTETRKPIEIKERGTIKGQVKFAGDKPDIEMLDKELRAKIDAKPQDSATCLAGSKDETTDQTWRIDEDGGLGNVFVWLKPPKGYYFKLTEDDLKPHKDEVVTLRQPHCAFLPHAFALFPSYYDGKKQQPTGQKLIVTNEAPMSHNTKWGGTGQKGNDKIIPPKGKIEVDPPLKPTDYEITINCSMHTWMNAFARAFDHPFAALTDKHGNFEIKNVPVGVDLQVVAWHEKGGYAQEGGKDGVKKKLKDGDEVNFTIKSK